MKLGYITVMVRDLERSLTFYQELAQLQVMRRFRPDRVRLLFWLTALGRRCWSWSRSRMQSMSAPGAGGELCRGGQFGRTAAKSG